MHQKCMDVCIEVMRVVAHADGFELKFLWWNLGYMGTPWACTGEIEEMFLPLPEAAYWHDITVAVYEKRSQSGLP